MKKVSNKFRKGAVTITIFWGVIFAGIALKLDNFGPTFSSSKLCPSLPSVPTGGKKVSVSKYGLMVTKRDHYFWNSVAAKK